MTVKKSQLREELNAVTAFIWHRDGGFERWYDFCEKYREDRGNQSLQSISMLVDSLTQPFNGEWRFLISKSKLEQIENLAEALLTDDLSTMTVEQKDKLLRSMGKSLKDFAENTRNWETHQA